MLKLTFVVSSTFSCLIAETICVCFSAGGAAFAEVAAFPVVLLSDAGDLVSAVGFLTSFEVSKVKRIRQANKMGRLKSRPHFLSQPLRDPPHTRPGAAAGPRAPAALADSKRHGTLLLLID